MRNLFIKHLKSIFASQQAANKLEHLDGFRGLAALLVVLHHFQSVFHVQAKYNRMCLGLGSFVGVTGFFILSAFLLTYRLMVDFERAQNYRICILKMIQYTIRRFFRIYLVFVLFLIIFYNFPKSIKLTYRPSVKFIDAILLERRIGGHLWTIAPEIKYYFFIPAISFCAFKCGRYWYLFAFSCLLLIGVLEYAYPEPGEIYFIRCANMFLKGSLLGIIYYNLKKNEAASKFIAKNSVQALITPLLACITLIQLKYLNYYYNPKDLNLTYRNKASSLMFIEIGLLIISEQSNVFTRFYCSEFLKSCGKFSFGIYLFHNIVLGCLFNSRRLFVETIDIILVLIVIVCVIGFFWFYLVENPLMKFANRLCKKCEKLQYFQPKNEIV